MSLNLITVNTTAPFAKPWGNYLLDELVETTSPDTISWFPQTMGWQLLALFAVIFISIKGYRAYQNYQRNAYRREALAWLKACEQADNIKHYKQLPVLLKKTAIAAFRRTEISYLSSTQWEQWLDEQCSKTSFSTQCPDLLYQLAYMPVEQTNISHQQCQLLIEQIRLWIKYHKDCHV